MFFNGRSSQLPLLRSMDLILVPTILTWPLFGDQMVSRTLGFIMCWMERISLILMLRQIFWNRWTTVRMELILPLLGMIIRYMFTMEPILQILSSPWLSLHKMFFASISATIQIGSLLPVKIIKFTFIKWTVLQKKLQKDWLTVRWSNIWCLWTLARCVPKIFRGVVSALTVRCVWSVLISTT